MNAYMYSYMNEMFIIYVYEYIIIYFSNEYVIMNISL